MSADTPETLAFDSLRPTEHLGPTEGGFMRLGEVLGLGARPSTSKDSSPAWWELARNRERDTNKEKVAPESHAFIFLAGDSYFFVSIDADALKKPVDELKEDQFAVAEIDQDFAHDLTIDELPVEIHQNGNVVFIYYELRNLIDGEEVADDAKGGGGTWFLPDPDPVDAKYKPTETAMKIDPDLMGYFGSYILEKRWQKQL